METMHFYQIILNIIELRISTAIEIANVQTT